MTRYVELDGGIVPRPPYLQKDTLLTAWLLRSDKAAQQALLDQAFNVPSGGAVDYRALTGHAVMSLADIKSISSLDPTDSQRGGSDEVDIVFWIPVGAYENGVFDRLLFFCPYIWVTNGVAMATGREVYGYPKSLAWAKVPSSPEDPGPLWAESMVMKHDSPSSMLTRERIFTLSRPAGLASAGPTFGPGDTVGAVTRLLDELIGVGVEISRAVLSDLVGDVFSFRLPIVFLKQLRDVASPTEACYQAIIEATATVTEYRSAGLLPPGWDIEIPRYDSVHVGETLGLGSRQSIDLGFWVDYSFSMDLGREVWRAR